MAEINELKERAIRMSNMVSGFTPRFVLEGIRQSLINDPRILLLKGFRGSGKTTLLLQLFSSTEKSMYIDMDDPMLRNESLYSVCREFINMGYRFFLIDEAQHYPNWRRDAKALYDEFRVKIVVSGSAPLAFNPERREGMVDLEPMGFREYLELGGKKAICSEDEWMDMDSTIRILAEDNELIGNFRNYIQSGGFPVSFSHPDSVQEALFNSVRKSVREDMPVFLKTTNEKIYAAESMLTSLATSKLGEFSIASSTSNIGISRFMAYELIDALVSMKILRMVPPYGSGPKAIRSFPKLMFSHPNLRACVCNAVGKNPDEGAMREEIAVFSLLMRGWKVYTAKGLKRSPDYFAVKNDRKIVVEVGGKSKKRIQLSGFKEGMVITEKQLIPLALF